MRDWTDLKTGAAEKLAARLNADIFTAPGEIPWAVGEYNSMAVYTRIEDRYAEMDIAVYLDSWHPRNNRICIISEFSEKSKKKPGMIINMRAKVKKNVVTLDGVDCHRKGAEGLSEKIMSALFPVLPSIMGLPPVRAFKAMPCSQWEIGADLSGFQDAQHTFLWRTPERTAEASI